MSNVVKPNGITGMEALTVAFVVLKLTHVIAWSWWWVLAPLWGGIVLVFLLSLLVAILTDSK